MPSSDSARLRFACGLLLSLPMTASFGQGQADDALDSLLGPDPAPAAATSPAAEVPAAASVAPAQPAAPAAAAAPAEEAAVPLSADPQAEPATKTAARPASRNRLVEEIVVTAQKREENIQDVPIAIAAFSAEKLDALGIQSAQDLERITPGLTLTNSAGFNVAYLRGIGTDAFLPGADTSVPFYLDGVALLSAQGSSDTLGRVERVEILKGPQGTLFGRNATGGAINIVTPEPGDEFAADVDAELGNFKQQKAVVYINLPIVKGLATSVSAFAMEQRNFYRNDGPGGVIGVYSVGGRAKVRWDVLDDLKLTLSGSYQSASNNAGLTFENTRVAPIFRAVLPQDPQANRTIDEDSLDGARINSYLFSSTVDWKPHYVDVKLIGSTQRLSAPFVQADFDKSALPIVNITSIKQVSPQVTGELQVLSNDNTWLGDRFKWVGGLFYLRSKGGFDPIAFSVAPDFFTTITGAYTGALANLSLVNSTIPTLADTLAGVAGLPPLTQGVKLYNYGVLTSRSYSIYFQGSYKILDSLDLTLGGRLQHELRDLVGSRTTVPTPNGEIPIPGTVQNPAGLKANQASPRVALEWHPFDNDSQVYASWSRAYKSPTFNTVNLLGGIPNVLSGQPNQIKPLKAERVNTYEVGAKADLFDGLLRLDGALFYTFQHQLLTGFVAVLSGGVVTYENAPAARTRGAEMDFVLTPLPDLDPGLAITGAACYLDGRYTDYPNGKGFDTTTGIAFGNDGTEPLPARNFDGNRIVRTPNFTGNLGINQSIPFGDGRFEVAMDGNYSSGFYFLPQDDKLYARLPYYLLNGRISYFYEPRKIEFTLYVQNATNVDYNEVVFVDDFGRNQVLNAPRTFGARAKWSF